MSIALRHWNRDTVLARLRASDAIDTAGPIDTAAAARQRLRLLAIGDQYEAGAIDDDEVVRQLAEIERRARDIVGAATQVPRP